MQRIQTGNLICNFHFDVFLHLSACLFNLSPSFIPPVCVPPPHPLLTNFDEFYSGPRDEQFLERRSFGRNEFENLQEKSELKFHAILIETLEIFSSLSGKNFDSIFAK